MTIVVSRLYIMANSPLAQIPTGQRNLRIDCVCKNGLCLLRAPPLGHHVRKDATTRIDRFGDPVTVIAGDDDRIASGIDSAHNADVASGGTACRPSAAPHDRDRSDLRSGNTRPVARKGTCEVRSAAAMAGPLQNEIHEAATPNACPSRRIGSDPAPRFRDEIRSSATRVAEGILAQTGDTGLALGRRHSCGPTLMVPRAAALLRRLARPFVRRTPRDATMAAGSTRGLYLAW